MNYFPLFLDLTERICLVVGGGRVACRKIKTLSACGAARIIVVDPYARADEVHARAGTKNIEFIEKPFSSDLLRGVSLTFACTADKEENLRIFKASKKAGIPCNVATCEGGDMILPALFSRGDLQIAVSTSGSSPALCRRVKEKLDHVFGPEYALLAELLRAIREPVLLRDRCQNENAALFRRLVDDDVLKALRDGDRQKLIQILEKELPATMQAGIGDLVDALV